MESKISVISGMITGLFAKIITGDLFTAIFTALLTGAAAYIGQQAMKYFHNKIKRK